MFTGLVENSGTLVAKRDRGAVLQVEFATPLGARLKLGDSIAVNGVCLTALEIDAERFTADLAAETIARTTLANLVEGTRVNLELPTPAGTPLGGHVVQGHVDGVGRIAALAPVDAKAGAEETDWRLEVKLPRELMRYVIEKGSIAVDGISLTVAGLLEDGVWIAILPHTYKATNLHSLKAGSAVNIEVDALAKYAEQLRMGETGTMAAWELTLAELVARGF